MRAKIINIDDLSFYLKKEEDAFIITGSLKERGELKLVGRQSVFERFVENCYCSAGTRVA